MAMHLVTLVSFILVKIMFSMLAVHAQLVLQPQVEQLVIEALHIQKIPSKDVSTEMEDWKSLVAGLL